MEDDVVRLLTEIRDNQREQLALAREQREIGNRAIDESVRLQRLAIRRQMIGIIIAIVFLAIGLAAIFFKA
ncbi:MAG TPA: hypothetical protein PLL20_11215 [Phycisphaerae bacterium]|nr:hypothetical protein [Phycisphaerae bacterium]HRR84003.1 hypothetical protein [Phycisphaerae bacterium]